MPDCGILYQSSNGFNPLNRRVNGFYLESNRQHFIPMNEYLMKIIQVIDNATNKAIFIFSDHSLRIHIEANSIDRIITEFQKHIYTIFNSGPIDIRFDLLFNSNTIIQDILPKDKKNDLLSNIKAGESWMDDHSKSIEFFSRVDLTGKSFDLNVYNYIVESCYKINNSTYLVKANREVKKVGNPLKRDTWGRIIKDCHYTYTDATITTNKYEWY